MAKIEIEIDEKTLRELVKYYLESKLLNDVVNINDVVIETKSKQNYRSEWEKADYRARYVKNS